MGDCLRTENQLSLLITVYITLASPDIREISGRKKIGYRKHNKFRRPMLPNDKIVV